MKKVLNFFVFVLIAFCAACSNEQMRFADAMIAGKSYPVEKISSVDVNGKDREGRNILRALVADDSVENMDFLLKNGADPFVVDSSGMSAYEYAAVNKKWRSLEILVPYVYQKLESNNKK